MQRPTDRRVLRGIRACVFDAYGTLFDVASAARGCPALPGEKVDALVALWRDRQLQYAWLRALQGRYVPFWQVTSDALDHVLEALRLDGDTALRARLLERYRTLSAFPDVADSLRRLREAGFALGILSNGSPDMLDSAVGAAGLADRFDALLSVDAVRSFKPDPRVYQLAPDRLGLLPEAIAFISANAWDVHAAAAFGLRAIWCNRAGQAPERLPGDLASVIPGLDALPALLLPR